jgi:hypothetical protein
MADYFFDTSALVKRHVDETGSKWVRSLIRAKATYRIYIARITAVEVFAAITRRQHSGDLSAPQAGAMFGHFRRNLDQRYRIIDLTPAILPTPCSRPASVASGPTTPCSSPPPWNSGSSIKSPG